LNVTPKNVTFLFFILFDSIFFTLSVKNILRFSLDLITDLIIDKSVLNKVPVKVKALVSFGKHARAAISANSLPLGAAVEIDAIFEVD